MSPHFFSQTPAVDLVIGGGCQLTRELLGFGLIFGLLHFRESVL